MSMPNRRGAISNDHLDPVKISHEIFDTYDYVSFTVADGITNYDLKTQQSTAFKNVPKATGIIIWHDQDITIRFNSTAMPAITHEMVNSPHEWFDKLLITNVYITNASGSTANIKVFLV